MPSICHSPSIKFKVLYCPACNNEINESIEIKCDECQKAYHLECTDQHEKQQKPIDIIWLCKPCVTRKNVCTKKDRIELKANRKTTMNQSNAPKYEQRVLRSRSQSIDCTKQVLNSNHSKSYKPIPANTFKEAVEIDIETKILSFEERIKIIENKECACLKTLEPRLVDSSLNVKQSTADSFVRCTNSLFYSEKS